MQTMKDILGEQLYADAQGYARVLHGGSVEEWVRDVVLQVVDNTSFQQRLEELMQRRKAA